MDWTSFKAFHLFIYYYILKILQHPRLKSKEHIPLNNSFEKVTSKKQKENKEKITNMFQRTNSSIFFKK